MDEQALRAVWLQGLASKHPEGRGSKNRCPEHLGKSRVEHG
jgi:hypothetical protein